MYLFNVYIQYIVYFGAMHLLLDIWICIVYFSVLRVFGEGVYCICWCTVCFGQDVLWKPETRDVRMN